MEEPSPAPRRVPAFALAAALLAALAAAAVVSDELGSMGGDSAEYVLLSKAIRDGVGYRTTWAPGGPAPHTLYPPVWPVLLLPFAGAAPESFLGAHLLLAALLGGAVLVLALLFERRGLAPPVAAAAALAPALSIHALRCAGDLLSEIPFLLFAALALLPVEPGPGDAPPAPRRLALAALFAGLAFLTRTAAIALAVPLALSISLDRRVRGRAAWTAAGALAAVCGAWFLYGSLAGGEATSYGTQLAGGEGGLLARAWGQFTGLYLPGTPAWLFPRSGAIWDLAGWLLWALGAVGLAAGIARRRGLAVAEAFFLAWLAMQSAWPHRDARFALPLAVLLVPFALEGAAILAARVPRLPAATARCVVPALAAALLLPNAAGYFSLVLPRAHRVAPAVAPPGHAAAGFTDTWFRGDGEFRASGPRLEAFLHACDLVRRGGPGIPDGPVMASNPRVAALLCGRPAVGAPAGASPGALAALARERGVALVIADGFGGDAPAALRAWADDGTGLEPVLAVPGGVRLLRAAR